MSAPPSRDQQHARVGRAAGDRREFLRAGATALAVLLPRPIQGFESTPARKDAQGVLVDLTRCNGCRRCEAACREANGFAVPTEQQLKDKSVFERHRRPGPTELTVVNRLEAPDSSRPVYTKINCMHCVDPACVSACIVGALRKGPDGAVVYDPDKCMGCRYCLVVCPFQMPAYEYADVFTPEVRKCTFCTDRTASEPGRVPACVEACPKECLIYGRRSDLLRRAHERIAEHPELYVPQVYGEHEAGGTSWLYLSAVPFEQAGLLKVPASAPPRLSEAIQHGVFSHFMPPLALCVILALAAWLTRAEPDGDRAEAERATARRKWPVVSGAGGDGRGRSSRSHVARLLNRSRFDRS